MAKRAIAVQSPAAILKKFRKTLAIYVLSPFVAQLLSLTQPVVAVIQSTKGKIMKRLLVFAYGVLSYTIFVVTFLYAFGFVGNLFVPRSIDSQPEITLAIALIVNVGLIAVFAVQHSLMARPAFKAWLTRLIPSAAERSTYVLFSSLALILLFGLWQPMGGTVWDIHNSAARTAVYVLFVSGWLIILGTTFLIDHFDLFGLRQVWLYLRAREYTQLRFTTPGPYRYVRHPLYVGWLIAFWATPTMTITHLLFALLTTAYILVAIRFEERDLVKCHAEYADYRRSVPMLLPRFTRTRADAAGWGFRLRRLLDKDPTHSLGGGSKEVSSAGPVPHRPAAGTLRGRAPLAATSVQDSVGQLD